MSPASMGGGCLEAEALELRALGHRVRRFRVCGSGFKVKTRATRDFPPRGEGSISLVVPQMVTGSTSPCATC